MGKPPFSDCAIFMFRLIAIKPLEGCANHVLKCLKVDVTYYLCNNFQIEGDRVSWCNNFGHRLQKDFFELPSDEHKEPHISERGGRVPVSQIMGVSNNQ